MAVTARHTSEAGPISTGLAESVLVVRADYHTGTRKGLICAHQYGEGSKHKQWEKQKKRAERCALILCVHAHFVPTPLRRPPAPATGTCGIRMER